MYVKVPIHRVVKLTDNGLGDKQCVFGKGKCCSDQIFVVRYLYEKMIEINTEAFLTFMELEKSEQRSHGANTEVIWS